MDILGAQQIRLKAEQIGLDVQRLYFISKTRSLYSTFFLDWFLCVHTVRTFALQPDDIAFEKCVPAPLFTRYWKLISTTIVRRSPRQAAESSLACCRVGTSDAVLAEI